MLFFISNTMAEYFISKFSSLGKKPLEKNKFTIEMGLSLNFNHRAEPHWSAHILVSRCYQVLRISPSSPLPAAPCSSPGLTRSLPGLSFSHALPPRSRLSTDFFLKIVCAACATVHSRHTHPCLEPCTSDVRHSPQAHARSSIGLVFKNPL
jgi:hypothetical protein